jgi:microcystin-dependent protein
MSQPFVGEIRCFGFSFAPIDWAFCNGQAVPIANFNALFAIIGTIYGGDGTTTFNLPNLQGQGPMHWGNGAGGFNTNIGQVQGTTNITLTQAQTPQHTHTITAQQEGSGGTVERIPQPNANAWLSSSKPDGIYDYTPTISPSFAPNAISTVGGSQPHDNMQPYLCLTFCISLNGIFPSRN